MILSVIVAKSLNNVIGKDNQLPWRLSDDLKFFKRTTTGHSIIMGRKTYDSIGKPLKDRRNIVVTRQNDLKIEGVEITNSIEEAIELCKTNNETEVFVIGGAEMIKQIISKTDRIYLTDVQANVEGDVFLPEINYDNYNLISQEDYSKNEKNDYDFIVKVLEKKSSS